MSSPVSAYWITTVGTSPCAVINTMWRALEEGLCIPARVALLHTPNDRRIAEGSLPAVLTAIEALADGYRIESPTALLGKDVQFDEDDPEDFLRVVRTAMKDALDRGLPPVVDITPGRKYMSAILMATGTNRQSKVHAIYYNHLRDMRYMQSAFPQVPRGQHELRDLKTMVKRHTRKKRSDAQ